MARQKPITATHDPGVKLCRSPLFGWVILWYPPWRLGECGSPCTGTSKLLPSNPIAFGTEKFGLCLGNTSPQPIPSSWKLDCCSFPSPYISCVGCMVDSGGEWSAINGSACPTFWYGDSACVGTFDDDSTADDTYGRLNWLPMLEATGVESPGGPLPNSPGLAKSDGDAVVAADIGGPRRSIP